MHTYLFNQGKWKAKGTYFDSNDKSIPLEGSTVITHSEKIWFNKGEMKLLAEPVINIQNTYKIKPFKNRQSYTTWTSYNPDIGELLGKFKVVEDSIISVFYSNEEHYNGIEFLIKTEKDRYLNRGYAFKDGNKLSSWSVELTKE